MIEAEAELELGNIDRAIALINQLRANVSLSPYAGPSTKADVLKQIFFERSVELFLEAKHFADLRRSGSPLLTDCAVCGPISWVKQNSNPNVR